MHTEYPRDLFIPIKQLSQENIYIIIPYRINLDDKYKSDVMCLLYDKGCWMDPLHYNLKFGLNLVWDTSEWEIIDYIPDKQELIFVIFEKLFI